MKRSETPKKAGIQSNYPPKRPEMDDKDDNVGIEFILLKQTNLAYKKTKNMYDIYGIL